MSRALGACMIGLVLVNLAFVHITEASRWTWLGPLLALTLLSPLLLRFTKYFVYRALWNVAVLGAGFRTTLITADVTLATWLRERDLSPMAAGRPFARELVRHVNAWAPRQRRIFTGIGGELADDNVAFLHDPLTVLALLLTLRYVIGDEVGASVTQFIPTLPVPLNGNLLPFTFSFNSSSNMREHHRRHTQ